MPLYNRILIVSASQKSGDALALILRRFAMNNIDFASSGVEARRVVLRSSYQLVIINAPLKDEQGSSLASDFIHSTHSSVILIAKSDVADMLASRVEGDGIFVIPKPLQQRTFMGAVRLALGFSNRFIEMEKEISKYEKKYVELRMVSRAKCVLIEKEGCSEKDAHRYIEKQAMDSRESKARIAENILKKYL